MSDYEFGTDRGWNCVFVLAFIGAVAVFAAVIAGIVWLFNHVRFV